MGMWGMSGRNKSRMGPESLAEPIVRMLIPFPYLNQENWGKQVTATEAHVGGMRLKEELRTHVPACPAGLCSWAIAQDNFLAVTSFFLLSEVASHFETKLLPCRLPWPPQFLRPTGQPSLHLSGVAGESVHMVKSCSAGQLCSPVEGQLEGHLNEGIGAAFLLFNECFPIVVKLINSEVKILYYSAEEKETVLVLHIK